MTEFETLPVDDDGLTEAQYNQSYLGKIHMGFAGAEVPIQAGDLQTLQLLYPNDYPKWVEAGSHKLDADLRSVKVERSVPHWPSDPMDRAVMACMPEHEMTGASSLAKQSYANMNKSAVDSMKPTNPKDGIGVKKAPLSTLSMPVVYEMALAMLDGGCKYRRHNYRVAGVRVSVYYDAAMRHINSWWEGDDVDEDSGVHHLAHAMACLMIIRDGEIFDNRTDDRPPSAPAKWLAFCNEQAKRIVEKYKGGKPPHVIGEEK